MKSPLPQRVNGDGSPSDSSSNGAPGLVVRRSNPTDVFPHIAKSVRPERSAHLPNGDGSMVGRQQLVSLNGSTVRCDSVQAEQAPATTDPKGRTLRVRIRENKWYDAADGVSTGVAGTSLNHALESMSLAYNPSTKQLYSLEESTPTNASSLPPSESPETQHLPGAGEGLPKNDESRDANDSPGNSLPGSCGSTVSSLSEVSPSGSLLGTDERPSAAEKPKRWPLAATLFSRNVFSRKRKDEPLIAPTSSSSSSSPSRNVDKVGGSLALIRQPRPANLPAKNALEEENHRKQHDAILEAARKRELREERKRRQRREQRLREEQRLAEDSYAWNAQILPRFDALRNTAKVRELWWRGLPPSIRGRVWKAAIGNDLNVTPHLYDLCLERATSNPANETLAAIELDVSRTLPTLCVFREGGPLSESLRDILAAYSVYRPDVGYVQGMSFVGAVLSLNMEPPDAFACFANLLNCPCHRAAFTLDQKRMNAYYKVYSSALAHRLPKVYAHFTAAGLSPDLYLLDWLYTVYAKAMPLDVTCRVWDVFLRDGEEFLFRTALGVLHLHQDELLKMDFVRGAQFLTRLPESLRSEALFDSIGQMSTTVGSTSFRQMLARYS